jgi:hypothetical protein
MSVPVSAEPLSADSGPVSTEPALTGELAWVPYGPLPTALLILSGFAFLRATATLVARLALGLRRPATVRLSARGLEVSHRVELLGRVLGEQHAVIPMGNLASVTREVRFARAGTYAGLAALVLGTYIGVSVLADGARAPGGSPSLMLLGLGIVALGLLLDLALTHVLDAARQTVRLVVRPQRGRAFCVAGLTSETVDALLRSVAHEA